MYLWDNLGYHGNSGVYGNDMILRVCMCENGGYRKIVGGENDGK